MLAVPDISVVLPTYNRIDYLLLTLKTILNQDFKNFEILILDDGSTDETEQKMGNIEDSRVHYIRNKKNIGYGENLKKGFRLAQAKYVFLISDDDLIVRANTFSIMFKEMEEKNAGFGEMGLMYYSDDYFKPTSMDHVTDQMLYLQPTKDIIIKTNQWHFGFISGHMFRKDLIKEGDLIDDVWFPYFKAIYRSILSNGCIYFGRHFIVARISTTGLIAWVDVKKNKSFYMNKIFEIYKNFDSSPARYQAFIKDKLDFVIGTLPGIKYYTSNENIKLTAREIVRNRPKYLSSFFFWKQLLGALLTPKLVLSFVRVLRLNYLKYTMKSIAEKYAIEKHLSLVLEKKL